MVRSPLKQPTVAVCVLSGSAGVCVWMGGAGGSMRCAGSPCVRARVFFSGTGVFLAFHTLAVCLSISAFNALSVSRFKSPWRPSSALSQQRIQKQTFFTPLPEFF